MKKFNYRPEHIDFLTKAYKKHPIAELTIQFNQHFQTALRATQVISVLKRYKITCGRTGHFEKGSLPWNNNSVGQGLTKGSSTSFKKGNRPKSWVPVGTECYTTKDNYITVKVGEPNEWKFKHRLVWERENGAVPNGMVIVFKDGDKDKCEIENLELISRAVLLEYNRQKGGDSHVLLRTPIRTLAALKVAQCSLEKNANKKSHEKQTPSNRDFNYV